MQARSFSALSAVFAHERRRAPTLSVPGQIVYSMHANTRWASLLSPLEMNAEYVECCSPSSIAADRSSGISIPEPKDDVIVTSS